MTRKSLKLVLIAVAIYAVAMGAVYLRQEQLLFYPSKLTASYPLNHAKDVTEVAIEVDGAVLSALHLRSPNSKRVALFFHGNAGNLAHWFEDVSVYREAGVDLLMVDYRGYGKSTGQIDGQEQLVADAAAAWRYLSAVSPDKELVLIGQSMGSGVAAQLAARIESGALPQPKSLKLALISPFESLQQLVWEKVPWVLPAVLRYPLRTDLAIARLKSPIHILHGVGDTLIPVAHAERLVAQRPGTQLVKIDGAGHNDLHQFSSFRTQLKSFLSD